MSGKVNMLHMLKSPIKVQIEVTSTPCTGDCYLCPEAAKKEEDLDIDSGYILKLINECYKSEVPRIAFAGPHLLQHDRLDRLADVLHYATELGMIISIFTCVEDNFSYNHSLIQKLHKYGVDKIELHVLAISEEVVKFMENCMRYMILPELCIIASDENCNTLFENAMKYKTFAKTILSPMNITIIRSKKLSNFKLLLQQIKNIEHIFDVVIEPSIPLCIAKRIGLRTSSICTAALTWCTIDHKGIIYPCSMLRIPAGSIREGLLSVWKYGLSRFRSIACDLKTCQVCELSRICRGGCLAMSYLNYGDFNKGDPLLRDEL